MDATEPAGLPPVTTVTGAGGVVLVEVAGVLMTADQAGRFAQRVFALAAEAHRLSAPVEGNA